MRYLVLYMSAYLDEGYNADGECYYYATDKLSENDIQEQVFDSKKNLMWYPANADHPNRGEWVKVGSREGHHQDFR